MTVVKQATSRKMLPSYLRCKNTVFYFLFVIELLMLEMQKKMISKKSYKGKTAPDNGHHFIILLFTDLTPCCCPVNQDKVFSLEPRCHIMSSSAYICLSQFGTDTKTLHLALKMPDAETFWVPDRFFKIGALKTVNLILPVCRAWGVCV